MNASCIGLTFNVQTFGCQMNKHDSERVEGMLSALGAEHVDNPQDADIVVFMTCCVRESADTRLYGHLSSMKSMPLRAGSPLKDRLVAVGGCIGQRDGIDLVNKLSYVDVVFGTHNLAALPVLLMKVIEEGHAAVEVLEASDDFSTDLPSIRENSWTAWLPITVGCDNFCTYCIVPHVRGRERSRALEDIVNDAKGYVQEQVKEITLLGQNVNSYGRDRYGAPRFAEVLDAVAATGIPRLRFATSHPKDLSDAVIARFAELPALMPALHLPVQSGSDEVLARMNRHYSAEHYLKLVEKLRTTCPDIALSTDIIVGFPGETEEDFQHTYDLVAEVGYHQVFTFIYSPREGTPAASFPDQVPQDVVHERFERLLKVVEKNALALNKKDIGTQVEVLIEGPSKREGILTGRTKKNQTVHFPAPDNVALDQLLGTFAHVSIGEARTWYLTGTLIG